MKNQRNTRSIWPYVVVGSAVGGAIAYLNATESGRKMRRTLTHPDELADCVENARGIVEKKARIVNSKVRAVLARAKEGLDAGQRAFHEAEDRYRSGFQRKIEGKNNEVAANVHKAVDNVSRTAYTVEQSVLEPLYEIGSIYRGVEKAVRTMFRRSPKPEFRASSMPSSIYSDRVGG